MAWEDSAGAWIRFVEADVNRIVLLDGPMLQHCDPHPGLDVLDVGCGEGRWCRELARHGCRTVGLDPVAELIQEARNRHPEGRYEVGVAEELPFESASFDLVVSYITLVDIEGHDQALGEILRVLRPGGRLVIANLNSWCTTRPRAWHVEPDGSRPYIAVEDYYTRRAVPVAWAGISSVMWHRPFEDTMGRLLDLGLKLVAFSEPRPTEEDVTRHPSMADEYRVPLFHVMAWEK